MAKLQLYSLFASHAGSQDATRASLAPGSKQHLPSFTSWQARQLVRRDVAFSLFMFTVSLVYLYKTLPELCSTGPSCNGWEQQSHSSVSESYERQHQLDVTPQCIGRSRWPRLWHHVCSGYDAAEAAASTTAVVASGTDVTAATSTDPGTVMSTVALAVSSVSQVAADLLAFCLKPQTVPAYFTAGLLSGDPLHLLLPPLCIAPLLLLLLPLPYPNLAAAAARSPSSSSSSSSSTSWISWYLPNHYWQRPAFRNSIVIGQRLLQYVAAAACVGCSRCQYVQYSAGLRYWSLFGKYAYQGWVAYMLVLPFRLQLAVSCLEWLIGYSTTIRVNILAAAAAAAAAAGSSTDASLGSSSSSDCFTTFMQQHQLVVSILLSIVLPAVAVWRLEKGQKQRYKRLQDSMHSTTAAAAAAGSSALGDADDLQQQKQQNANGSCIGLDVNKSNTKMHKLDRCCDSPDGVAFGSSSSSGGSSGKVMYKPGVKPGRAARADGFEDTCYDMSVSGLAAELAAFRNGSSSSSSSTAAACDSTDSSDDQQQFLADITSSLKLAANHKAVPYDKCAVSVTAAAAAPAAAAVLQPQPVPKELLAAAAAAAAVPGSQAGSSALSGLAPKVRSLLADEAAEVFAAAAASAASAGSSSSSGLTRYKSMAGCLPINIKVYTPHSQVDVVGPLLQCTLNNQMQQHSSNTAPVQITAAAFAGCVQLLANVIALQEQQQQQQSGSSSSRDALAANLLTAVRQTFDASVGQPDVDVAVGTSSSSNSSSSVRRGASSSSSSSVSPVSLHALDPVCLIAGVDQQIRLQLKLSGLSGPQGDLQPDCQGSDQIGPEGRLLIFSAAGVICDLDVDVSAETISVSIPAQRASVLHLALLPGKKPVVEETDGAENVEVQAPQQQQQQQQQRSRPPAPAAPLLLLPLLVLPEAAAAEVQQYYQQVLNTPAAAVAAAQDSAEAAAWEAVAAFSVDVAYVLNACQTAAAAAAATAAAMHNAPGQQQQQQIPVGVQAVLKNVLVHAAACGMWHVMHYIIQTAAAVFTYADPADSAAAAAAANKNGSSSSSSKTALVNIDVGKSARKADDAQPGSSSSSSRSVKPAELLWGFADPSLEAKYQAAAFSSSGLLDFVHFVFMGGLGLGTYAIRGPTALQWSAKLLLSQVTVLLCTMAAPLAVLVLRRLTINRVRCLALQQQQQQGANAHCGSSSSSSKCTRSAAAEDPAAAAVLAAAAKTKRVLVAIGMVLVPVWAVILAMPGLVITPAWVIRVMGHRGVSQEVGAILGFALKGYTDQVPFSWFWRLTTIHIIVNSAANITHGLRPYWWVAMRNLPSLLLALVVAARQQVHGRRAFCRQHGFEVVCDTT